MKRSSRSASRHCYRWPILVLVGAAVAIAAEPPPDVPRPRRRKALGVVIAEAGKNPPGWLADMPLKYPKTLDLAGTQRSRDRNVNLGRYKRFNIDVDRRRFREGIKLLHHAVSVRKGSRSAQAVAMALLGSAYYDYLGDWARAAYWWHTALKARWRPTTRSIAELARCYWKLGSKRSALALLSRVKLASVSPKYAARLLAEMGESVRAVALAAKLVGPSADSTYLTAGNICRTAGEYDKAIAYYEKASSAAKAGPRGDRNRTRAKANGDATRLLKELGLARVPDGTYAASSPGFRGPVHVEVTTKGGKMTSVRVTRQQEDKYNLYRAVPRVPDNIVARQGIKGVDVVTRATITSEAILNAVAKALAKATK